MTTIRADRSGHEMMTRADGEPLVKVAQAGNQALAEMWRELLRNNGIPSLVRIAGPLTAYASFTSPHDILVLAADADAARDLLAAFHEDTGDLAPTAEGEPREDEEDEYWLEGAEERERG
jgi:hypothetical protein